MRFGPAPVGFDSKAQGPGLQDLLAQPQPPVVAIRTCLVLRFSHVFTGFSAKIKWSESQQGHGVVTTGFQWSES